MFPFTVQLAEPERLAAPQRVIGDYARANKIPFVDLLPPLVAVQAAQPTDSLFIDHDHLSESGHRAVATVLADSIPALLRRP